MVIAMKKWLKSERGALIVEATIVFPTMFLVIALMLFVSNAYLQKCKIDSFVNRTAIVGAAYCADPLLQSVEKGQLPSINELNVQPYRYLFGTLGEDASFHQIERQLEDYLKTNVAGIGTGYFLNMIPKDIKVDCTFNNGFIHSSFSSQVNYKITIPVRLLGFDEFFDMQFASRVDVPVSDTPEFIRNVNMIEDYMQKFGATEKIQELVDHVNGFFNKGEKKEGE